MNAALGLLEVAGLIRQSGAGAESEFAFRHTLLRETAYGSLLNEERKALHRAVGGAIERVFPEVKGETASVLAQHFLAGEVKDKALGYLRLAGDAAARVYALEEALDHYRLALELAKDGHGRDEDVLHLYERLGRMLELAGRHEEALASYRSLEKFGRDGSKPQLELRGVLRQATLNAIPSAVMDRERARKLSQDALSMAEEQGDALAQSLALWNLMKVNEFGEDFLAARAEGERALALVKAADLKEQQAYLLNDLTGIYLSTADFPRGREVNQQARELWLELDNLPMLVDAYCNEVTIHLLQGEFEDALSASNKALNLSEEIDNVWGKSFSRYMTYWIHAEWGDMASALETARECVSLGEEAGFIVPLVQTEADIGLLHAHMGQFAEAHRAVERSLNNSQRLQPQWTIQGEAVRILILVQEGKLAQAEPLIATMEDRRRKLDHSSFSYYAFIQSRVLPEYWVARQEWDRAYSCSQDYLDLFDRFGIMFMKYDLLLAKGKALLGINRGQEARVVLEEAERLAQAVGSRRSLWRIKDALAFAAKELGDERTAGDHEREARGIIEYIADHAEDEEQRRSFMTLVREWSMTKDLG